MGGPPAPGAGQLRRYGARGPLEQTTLRQFRTILDQHLVGTFLALRTAASAMRDGGAVVTISSLRGVLATAELGAYGAAKFGVRALTKVAALELADRGIRVNSVCPGFIETPQLLARYEGTDRHRAMLAHIPMARLGRAEEVGAAVAFLAGDDSTFVTGTELCVDGGWTCA